MAEQVFVHVGPPKSGTTYLQSVLWAHRTAAGAGPRWIRFVGNDLLVPLGGSTIALRGRQVTRIRLRAAESVEPYDEPATTWPEISPT